MAEIKDVTLQDSRIKYATFEYHDGYVSSDAAQQLVTYIQEKENTTYENVLSDMSKGDTKKVSFDNESTWYNLFWKEDQRFEITKA